MATTRVIAWQTDTGELWLTYPNDLTGPGHQHSDPPLEGESEEHYLDRIAMGWLAYMQEHTEQAKALGEPLPPKLTRLANVERATLPTDRTFRGAWMHDGVGIAHDMTKARAIHAQRLLARRDARMLTAAVAAFLSEPGAPAKLQRLRRMEQTLPALLAAVPDVATLAAFVPPDLT